MKRGETRRGGKISLRQLLYMVMALTLTLVIVIYAWVLENVMGLLAEKNEQYLDEVISMECRNLARKFDEISKIIYTNGYDPSVQSLLNCENAAEGYELRKTLSERMKYDLIQREDVLDYAIIGVTRSFNVAGRIDRIRSIIQPRANGRFGVEVLGPLFTDGEWRADAGGEGEEMVIVFGSPIYTFSLVRHSMEYVGYSAVVCRTDGLLVSANETNKLGTRFYLVNEDGVVVAQSTGESMLGKTLDAYQDRDRWKERSADVGFGMRLVGLTDYNDLYSELKGVSRNFFMVFGMGTLVIVLLFTFAIRRVIRPIQKLSRFIAMMQFTELDVFNQRIELNESAEMSSVAQQFNRMLEQIRSLTQSLLQANNHLHEAKLEQERAKLYSLRSQINPHFLYNTLECAKGLAYQNQVPSLAHMLDSMARIFRYSIKGSGMVLLKDELEVSRAYLSIQQARFPGRFECRYEIEERAYGALIPKMTLQPLIENSIYHGIEPTLETCLLTIRASVNASKELILEVRDDGQGMDAQSLQMLRQRLQTGEYQDEEYNSIGIGNIAHRIHLIYGDAYGIAVESELGQGMRVMVRLPFEEN